jgi:2-oxoglutarate ferredoxin oxidoreductase subunit delta
MSRIIIDEDRCKGCALCTLVCPFELVQISKRFSAKGYRPATLVDPDGQCIGCANCAMMCPDTAIVVYRTRRVPRAARPEPATEDAGVG